MATETGFDEAPVFETERLRFRPHRLDDFEDIIALWSEPEVIRHTYRKPTTRSEAWARLLLYVSHWRLLGYGYWAVEEKATGGFVGGVGIARFERDMDPPLGPLPEAGWALASRYHGRGVGKEAVSALLTWADDHLNADATCCIIDPANEASVRLAETFGYRFGHQATYLGDTVSVLKRPRRAT